MEATISIGKTRGFLYWLALLDRIEQAMGKPIARVAVPQDFDTVEEELEIEE